MLIKQAVKNNNLTTLITDAYLYISIRLLSVLAFFFFFNTYEYIAIVEK